MLLNIGLGVPATTTEPEYMSVWAKIDHYADLYGVDRDFLEMMVNCETAGTFDPKIQSGYHYKFSDPKRGIAIGDREKSYGLAQISLPHHPEVSYEEAIDPDFALNFLAKNLSEGKGWLWSCHPVNY